MLDLSDDEAAALTQELHDIVENDRYFLSPRIRTLKQIRGKIKLYPFPEPLQPPKVYTPVGANAARRRRVGPIVATDKKLDHLKRQAVSDWQQVLSCICVHYC
jgi:hypothetical protein